MILRAIFPDACFDVSFSNATIEHVGDERRQARFRVRGASVGQGLLGARLLARTAPSNAIRASRFTGTCPEQFGKPFWTVGATVIPNGSTG